ncbi:MAG: carboxymuconolactone decarboxylase family protein [Vicingaceae bacterium]|nr:carboxymuconolactone decarboxylase family protein [Vicingaceae bacterium]
MAEFKLHTFETAPEASKPLLEEAINQNGFIPNLYGIMAESPELLKAYRQMADLFNATSFSPVEKNIVWLTISYQNKCHYCMTIHSMVANMFKLPESMVDALRNNKPLTDTKLESLRKFTILLVEKRGWASDEDVQEFLSAGYSKKNVLELVVGVGQKIISNYVNHLANTPLDDKIVDFKWEANTVTN